VVGKTLGSDAGSSSCRAPRRERIGQGHMSEKLLTIAEAATILRLHRVTLQALAAARETPFKLGRAWRCAEVDERTGTTQPNTHRGQPVEVVELPTKPRRSSCCIAQLRATAPTAVPSHDEWAPDGRRPTVQLQASA
jgi:hypothetical protein